MGTVRGLALLAVTVGIVMGPAGCADYWDMDPPARILYQGQYESEVQACTMISYSQLLSHGTMAVNWQTDQVQISEDKDSGRLLVQATTENVGGHTFLDWTCDVPIGARTGQATLTRAVYRDESD